MIRKSYNSGSYVAYTYNAEGSLARLSYGDSTGELASYRFEYDSLGRLICSAELDADGGTVQRTEHIYDGYNRLSRQSWTLGGNPKNWYNGTTYTGLTWKNGRQLAQITTGGRTSAYRYDADGIRTYKKVGSVAHEYRTLNGKVVYEKIGSGSTAKIMVFSYDAQGRPFAVKYSANNGGSYI